MKAARTNPTVVKLGSREQVKRRSSPRRHVAYRRQLGTKRPCNLCRSEFVMRSPFDRFCSTCKSEKDIFRFAEWLPNLSMAM